MKRHAHMVDLLRTDFDLGEVVQNFQYKRELTLEDYDLLIKNVEVLKKAAEIRKSQISMG